MKHAAAIAVVMVFLSASVIYGASIWQDRNIYASGENLAVGDVLQVEVEDISRMRFNLKLAQDESYSVSSNPDGKLTPFLPPVSSNRNSQARNSTSVTGRGNMTIQMAARVAEELPDGKYRIQGTRTYSFSGIANVFTVTGIVDPVLLKGRKITSKDIANMRLDIRGVKEGAGINVQRPPLEEDEAASATLTEEEKQAIIVDYLQRMLGEITQ